MKILVLIITLVFVFVMFVVGLILTIKHKKRNKFYEKVAEYWGIDKFSITDYDIELYKQQNK